jgi:hypothetical protein
VEIANGTGGQSVTIFFQLPLVPEISVATSSYGVFANMILAGNIMCSSLFPNGRALVLPYKDGQILAHVWDELSNRERTHVREGM